MIPKVVTAKKAAFDEAKHDALFEKLNPFVGVDTLKDLVRRGSIVLFEVYADDLLLGILLSRVDTLYNGRPELVIMHASAVVKPPLPLTCYLDPLFTKIAQDHGCRSVRIHSDKKGLDRMLEAHNYVFWETVYRKEI